ncbi:MAG: helix-turn-helix transcriptional regulator [Bradyrhizobium sp.]|nr:helix-turn-helix transcriptional regulator [Bradyrhizobium sp.]
MIAKSQQAASDWLEILRAACAGGSQRDVSQKLGYSQTVVNQVLKGSYKGDLKRVRAAVEGALMQHEVECPVCGVIPRQRCVEHQRKPFTATSPMNVALYRACRGGCPNALNSAKPSAQNTQPAVAQNTGSADSGFVPFPAKAEPTGPRKGLSRSRKHEVKS